MKAASCRNRVTSLTQSSTCPKFEYFTRGSKFKHQPQPLGFIKRTDKHKIDTIIALLNTINFEQEQEKA